MSLTPSHTPDDDERAEITRRLTEHVGTGHLTLADFDERVQRLWSATTKAELALITADLPATRPAGAPDHAARPVRRRAARRWLVSIFSGSGLNGRWRLSGVLRSVAIFGGADIDVREAEVDVDEDGVADIVAFSLFGGQDIYLPAGVDVQVGGFALFGGNDVHGGGHPVHPGAPSIRVRAFSVFGGTDVWRVPPGAARVSRSEARRAIKAERHRY
ncbi:MAG TPA: DUF1707 domain-containing protein [Pseudonocardiaceae bacterium]